MNITNLRRTPGKSGALALFDIEVAPGFRLHNWILRRAPDGIWTTYAPILRGGTPSAKPPLHIREQITAAAATEYNGGRVAHDNRDAA